MASLENEDVSDFGSIDLITAKNIVGTTTPIKCKTAFPDKNVVVPPPHSPPLFYDDLQGDIPIKNIWRRKFGQEKEIADQGWLEFRQDAVRQYDLCDKTLTDMEKQMNLKDFDHVDVDIEKVLELKENVQNVYTSLGDYEGKIEDLTKVFEQFSQYLTRGDHRKQVNEMIRNIQKRYFAILQVVDRKNETLLWVIPRLQRYISTATDFKTWLRTAESRSKRLISNIDNCEFLIQNWDQVEELVQELHVKKTPYEELMEPGKSLLVVEHEMKINNLLSELEDLEERWDCLCSAMEKCVNKVVSGKIAAELQNKSEMEKIHIKIQQEVKKCTCFSPFRILKVEEGKYTFGSSKTVRLLRIHGSSVVVRVGGGWEYLYNFLLKVDPCRAKQHTVISDKNVDAVRLSALSLTTLNTKDLMLNMSVKRMRKTSLPAHGLGRSPGITYSPKSRKSFGSPGTPKTANSIAEVAEENNLSTPKKNPNRRYSLMERQSLYAQKR